MMLGSDVHEYDGSRLLVFAVDLPVSGQVTRASQREPYLGFRLELVPSRIAELASRVFPQGVPRQADECGLYVGRATDEIVEASTRLLDLMGRPEEADLLGPLVIDEILIRLLRTSIGPRVALIGEPKSGVHRIGRAISWIRTHFAQAGHRRRNGGLCRHECLVVPSAIQGGDDDEPVAISEDPTAAGGAQVDALPGHRREPVVPSGRLRQRLAVQPRIHASVWEFAGEGHCQAA